ncbi:hypothetical protein BV898_06839 [Hypsibius exemplaris]|uniref:Uncharacterized protein n=1 Tax=Hypsibius exemplaris TaxID=2072580 RepID=A0A1W0WVN3_HYPEX|nr:hypothetical protein BV898_06839 [Hypsibius exemplaris]
MITAWHGKWMLGDTACQINGLPQCHVHRRRPSTRSHVHFHPQVFSIRNVFKTTITIKPLSNDGCQRGSGDFFYAAVWVAAGQTLSTNSVLPVRAESAGSQQYPRKQPLHLHVVTNFVIPLVVIRLLLHAPFSTPSPRHTPTLGDDGPTLTWSRPAARFFPAKKDRRHLIIVLVGFLICGVAYILYSSPRSPSPRTNHHSADNESHCFPLAPPSRVARGGPTPAPVIYRQYRTPILEERSSQLAKWDKNPDTDSGRAESDGEYHDSENRSAGSVEDALPHDDGPVHHPTDEAHISSFILENERLLGDIEEERGYRLPLPLDLLQTIV